MSTSPVPDEDLRKQLFEMRAQLELSRQITERYERRVRSLELIIAEEERPHPPLHLV